MTVYPFRVSNYARNIYIYGVQRLTARDGFTGVPAEYYGPVEQYAANNYSMIQIDNALSQTWINQQEYDETIALMG
jgi:hypothetical protein